jgi:hypothetical protein
MYLNFQYSATEINIVLLKVFIITHIFIQIQIQHIFIDFHQ